MVGGCWGVAADHDPFLAASPCLVVDRCLATSLVAGDPTADRSSGHMCRAAADHHPSATSRCPAVGSIGYVVVWCRGRPSLRSTAALCPPLAASLRLGSF